MRQRYFFYVFILFVIPAVLWGNPRSYEKVTGVSSYHGGYSGNYGPGFYVVDAAIKEASEVMLKRLGLWRGLRASVNSDDRIVVEEVFVEEVFVDVVSIKNNHSFSELVNSFNHR